VTVDADDHAGQTEMASLALRWFAEYQPFTPIIETLRGLLMGMAIGNSAIVAIAWCAGVTVVCFRRAHRAYKRDPVR
jgi:ABC-2 type transport system permease protein